MGDTAPLTRSSRNLALDEQIKFERIVDRLHLEHIGVTLHSCQAVGEGASRTIQFVIAGEGRQQPFTISLRLVEFLATSADKLVKRPQPRMVWTEVRA
jgi:hypothetical protein